MAKKKHNYEVIVSNVGSVYHGTNGGAARATYVDYEQLSLRGIGRASGESVTMLVDGEIEMQHHGTGDGDEEPEPDSEPDGQWTVSALVGSDNAIISDGEPIHDQFIAEQTAEKIVRAHNKVVVDLEFWNPRIAGQKLTSSELATILAALRLFQKCYRDKDESVIGLDFDHFSEAVPLSSEGIDELCERLNCA